jgi:uncharacterized protein (DUF433 family)
MGDWEDHIVIDERVMAGKPIIKNTRLTVEHILDLLERGWTREQILHEHPGITADEVVACVAYASEVQEARRALEESKEQGSMPFDQFKKKLGL